MGAVRNTGHRMSSRSLESQLGIGIPILQAPIGSMSSPQLAAAVSNAGAMGSIALTWCEPGKAARQVAATRALTRAPFFGNFVLSFPPASLAASLDAGLPVVTFSWGLPGNLVNDVRARGALIGIQVGTAEGARRALDGGCDFLVCQGVEAGGHVQSSKPLSELLSAVLDLAGDVPVVAAGGLADGGDIGRVLRAGAAGAMLGTRFVASVESLAHADYKRALVEAGSADTAMSGCFDGGWPYALHRVLRNVTLADWEAAGCPPAGARPGEGDVVATFPGGEVIRRYDDSPPRHDAQGSVLECCLYAGAGVGKIRDVRPAAQLVEELWRDARAP
jgi:nitronate monooxygenase